ncbi:MAG: fumarylacetoacetate hydrolase family protein [Alphaproteobacteria bacterium]|nr:fumarylacetoacetate hydrolase family protein [Alphaproteobacteria bacterium]
MFPTLTVENTLPTDGANATLVGRVWLPEVAGPAVVVVRDGEVFDVSRAVATMSELINAADPRAILQNNVGVKICSVAELLANTVPHNDGAGDNQKPWLLTPIDLQTIKANGVTFAASMLERVIEEKAMGDPVVADEIRDVINEKVGANLAEITPGSDEAERVKQVLIEQDMWSQYLEVGIGPYAEVFTKAPTMSSVGAGFEVGIHPESTWNNPEPEVVLVVSAAGKIVGATLGNDVNLRDFEGRSALLLGKAKDNNASAALGPFIRLVDDGFGLDDIRQMDLAMSVDGEDGYHLSDGSSMKFISRDIEDLVGQTISRNHQYPDGLVLYTGTMFAPTDDRGEKGSGFTHKVGDIVRVSSPKLGTLTNRVNLTTKAPEWVFGVGALMKNLAKRGLV